MRSRASWPFAVAGLALAALSLLAAEQFRSRKAPANQMIAVTFEHADHKGTGCVECHHNYVDQSGGGSCYNCHKNTADIAGDIEKMFHDFCFDCHVSTRMDEEESGPMRECSGCHSQ